MKKLIAILSLVLFTAPLFAQNQDDWSIGTPAKHRSYFGYRMFLDGSYGMGLNIQNDPFSIGLNKPLRYFSAGTTHGMQFGKFFFLGVGASYSQLLGDEVIPDGPVRHITAYGDLRFTFGEGFGFYIDLKPGYSVMFNKWADKTWQFATSAGIGFDIARYFQIGLEFNILPLNLNSDHQTQFDALAGLHASLSFGRGNKK